MKPAILLSGKAGAGKDTVAQYLVDHHNAVALAMADPMKRLAKMVFDFTDDQLWGPSESRNRIDDRFYCGAITVGGLLEFRSPAWVKAEAVMDSYDVLRWCGDVLPNQRAAPALKEWFADVWRDRPRGLTPRYVLQTLGTEFGRKIDDQMWIDYAKRVQQKLLCGGYRYDRTQGLIESPETFYHMAVVTDGRFPNEVLEFGRDSTCVRILDVTPGTDTSAAVQSAGVQGHSSEAAQEQVPDFWFDAVIRNNKKEGLQSLYDQIDFLLTSMQMTYSLGYK